MTISIHAAREGGDGFALKNIFADCSFQSTPPVKAATLPLRFHSALASISIHAAREGGDYGREIRLLGANDISIHAAREGGDLLVSTVADVEDPFQSTPPVKAAT